MYTEFQKKRYSLMAAEQQIDNVIHLMKGDEYVRSHLMPVRYEIKRQLTNLLHSHKLEQQGRKER